MTLGLGQIGFRYLLLGGADKSYAVSLNPLVAVPTGNRRLLGGRSRLGDTAAAPSGGPGNGTSTGRATSN